MGEQQEESKVEIQEKGEILFFYRPKVEKEEAHSSDDVQRLYIVLKPEELSNEDETKQEVSQGSTDNTTAVISKKRKINDDDSPEETQPTTTTLKHKDDAESGKPPAQEANTEKQTLMRLMVMGRKSLPDPHSTKEKGRPYWGFVEMVTTNIDDLKDALKGGEYDTATRGRRHTSHARALGEGIYEIVKHINPGGKNKKMHTHLVYKLRFPKEKDEESKEASSPQESLNIEHEASFLIQIKNPSGGGGGNFRGLQSKSKAEFPTYLQDKFGELRYSPADPTDFLNYVGCEFLLIAASDDISEELGLELETEDCETPDEAASVSCSDLLKTFTESSNIASSSSIAPLLKGIWA